MKIKTLKLLGAASLSLMLAACGGGDGSALKDATDKINAVSSSSSSAFTGNSSQSNASTVSSINTTTLSNIGYGSGTTFQANAIGVGIGTNNLSAGGITTLTVNLVSVTGTLVTQEATVKFNSKCFAAQKALLSSTSVTTNTGEASVTYTAKGCVGDDLITATVTHESGNLTAQTTLNIAMDIIQTVTFVDATPPEISLKGTGGSETSDVRFQVLGQAGAPIEGVTVSFALSTTIGGLSLTKATAKTNALGYAYTTVQAGTISTSARVTATTTIVGVAPAPDVKISTQSSQLLVSTGIPDQKSMSLSVDVFNPAAMNYDNVVTNLTVLLADAFNNPAPDGTAVSFTTEGGSIGHGCNTKDGSGVCTVQWKSQEPKPSRASNDLSPAAVLCIDPSNTLKLFDSLPDIQLLACQAQRAGRITILATAIGNESFMDKDGDGIFTPGTDTFKTAANGGDCAANVPISSSKTPAGSNILPCDDLPEAYLDFNESKTLDGDERIIDFSNSTSYTAANGLYNGVLCSEADALNNKCSRKSVNIRKELILAMSCHRPYLITTATNTLLYNQAANITLGLSGSANAADTNNVALADCNGNALPAGTTVTVDTSNLENAAVTTSLGTGTVNNDINGQTMKITYRATSKTDLPTGSVYFSIVVPTPSGKVTTSIGPIEIN